MKDLRVEAALIEADCDQDWRYFEEHVAALEQLVIGMKDGLVRDAVGFVVVQIYLNKIRRDLED